MPSLNAIALWKALNRGFNQQEISEKYRENTENWIEAVLQFAAEQTVGKSAPNNLVKPALEDAEIQDKERQQKFARLFNQ